MVQIHTEKEIQEEIISYGNPMDLIHSFKEMKKGQRYSLYLSLVANNEILQTQELMYKTYSVEEEISKMIKEKVKTL